MRKRVIFLTVVAALVAVLAAVLCACEPKTKLTNLQSLQNRYNEIGTAQTIKQTITIKKGEMTQFESVKTFTKTEEGYSVSGTEKQLNDSDADDMFTVTPVEGNVQRAEGATPQLKLDEKYFEEGYRLSETGLTARIKSEYVKEAFGIDGDIALPTGNLTLELVVSAERVETARIAYVSNGSNVVIELAMTY